MNLWILDHMYLNVSVSVSMCNGAPLRQDFRSIVFLLPTGKVCSCLPARLDMSRIDFVSPKELGQAEEAVIALSQPGTSTSVSEDASFSMAAR